MTNPIEESLRALNIELPEAAAAAGNYVPYVISGNQVFVSGQITMKNGQLQYLGRLGESMSEEDGYKAARLCGLNLLAQLRAACDGDLSRVSKVINLGGFVNSTPDFVNQPKIINGASDLMVEVFGKAIGQHARFAVGSSALPLGISVEVNGVFEKTSA